MGSPTEQFTAGLTGIGAIFGTKGKKGFMDDVFGANPPPKAPDLPPPIETIDVSQRKKLARKKASERTGRSSTILGSQTLGNPGSGKTVLG